MISHGILPTLAYVAFIAVMWTWGHTSPGGRPLKHLLPAPFSDCDQSHFCPHPALASPGGTTGPLAIIYQLPQRLGSKFLRVNVGTSPHVPLSRTLVLPPFPIPTSYLYF